MAYLGEIDTSTIEPSKPREIIPPGWYKAFVEASDVKPTKKALEAQQYGAAGADDRKLELTFKVLEGEHANRLIWESLNIFNSNPTAQEIAQRDLAAIMVAIGKPGAKVKDSTELHNRPLMIQVDVERKEGYNPRNIVKGYKPVEGAAAAVPPAAQAAAPKAKPAWAS